MNEQKFWEMVAVVDYQNLIGKERADTSLGKRRLMAALQKEDGGILKAIEDFRAILGKKLHGIEKAIEKYEKANDTRLDYGGDDSFSDLIHHVVAMGQKFYDKAIADPSTLKGFKYRESFAYCVPYKDDVKELDPNFHQEKARAFLGEWGAFRYSNEARCVTKQVEYINGVAETMARGEIEALPDPHDIRKVWREMIATIEDSTVHFGKMLKHYEWLKDSEWHLSNIVSDARKAILPIAA
jgi:hypothetical protein